MYREWKALLLTMLKTGTTQEKETVMSFTQKWILRSTYYLSLRTGEDVEHMEDTL